MSAVAVLVVEDEAMIAMDLEDELRDAGFDVVGAAATVAEARALLDRRPADVAVLDINLRGETSFDLARDLAAARVGFAFVSGNGAGVLPPDLADRPLLSKPVRTDLLFARLRALAAGSGAPQDAAPAP